MTHTSTEQPEALRLAEELRECHPSKLTELKAASVIISQHARILELEAQTAHMVNLVELVNYATEKLEAAQAQRAPLDAYKLREIIKKLNANHDEGGWNFGDLVQEVEIYHGITQEKQG